MTGLVSGRPEKASHMAGLHGVDARHVYSYERYDDIANDPAIDVVYIALPNSMHAEYTVRALEAGRHVLCEKPMANTPAECEQMIAAARAADRNPGEEGLRDLRIMSAIYESADGGGRVKLGG